MSKPVNISSKAPKNEGKLPKQSNETDYTPLDDQRKDGKLYELLEKTEIETPLIQVGEKTKKPLHVKVGVVEEKFVEDSPHKICYDYRTANQIAEDQADPVAQDYRKLPALDEERSTKKSQKEQKWFPAIKIKKRTQQNENEIPETQTPKIELNPFEVMLQNKGQTTTRLVKNLSGEHDPNNKGSRA